MNIEFLLKKGNNKKYGLLWNNKFYTYKYIKDNIEYWSKQIKFEGVKDKFIVGLSGDFSPNTIAILFSLIKLNCIIVPFNYSQKDKNNSKYKIANIEFLIEVDQKDHVTFQKITKLKNHELYDSLIKSDTAGLVMFTSGTSGVPKAAVHDLAKLLDKFRYKRKALRTINFLLFDHWGGLNTMFHILSNGGVVITAKDRRPESICKLIEKYKIELLPTSPTFLNLMLLSGSYKSYYLSSLKIISYGTEPMPEYVLKTLNKIFPQVKILQTYGLIELGVLRSKSKKNDSLWVKIGGEGYKTRIIDGILQIQARSAMLGYLNAPSPFTEDGWFITGDEVLQKGDYIKILGRRSEIINVGGEKVYPAEVENVIQELDFVIDVEVYAEKNLIVGNIVCAKVKIDNQSDIDDVEEKIKSYCRSKLEAFKIPIKLKLVDQNIHSFRFKKIRTHS